MFLGPVAFLPQAERPAVQAVQAAGVAQFLPFLFGRRGGRGKSDRLLEHLNTPTVTDSHLVKPTSRLKLSCPCNHPRCSAPYP